MDKINQKQDTCQIVDHDGYIKDQVCMEDGCKNKNICLYCAFQEHKNHKIIKLREWEQMLQKMKKPKTIADKYENQLNTYLNEIKKQLINKMYYQLQNNDFFQICEKYQKQINDMERNIKSNQVDELTDVLKEYQKYEKQFEIIPQIDPQKITCIANTIFKSLFNKCEVFETGVYLMNSQNQDQERNQQCMKKLKLEFNDQQSEFMLMREELNSKDQYIQSILKENKEFLKNEKNYIISIEELNKNYEDEKVKLQSDLLQQTEESQTLIKALAYFKDLLFTKDTLIDKTQILNLQDHLLENLLNHDEKYQKEVINYLDSLMFDLKQVLILN